MEKWGHRVHGQERMLFLSSVLTANALVYLWAQLTYMIAQSSNKHFVGPTIIYVLKLCLVRIVTDKEVYGEGEDDKFKIYLYKISELPVWI